MPHQLRTPTWVSVNKVTNQNEADRAIICYKQYSSYFKLPNKTSLQKSNIFFRPFVTDKLSDCIGN